MKHVLKFFALLVVILTPPATFAAIELVGPKTGIEVGEIVDFVVQGLPADALKASKVSNFPKEKVRVKPYLTWAGDPMVEFSARRPGTYHIVVAASINGTLEYVEIPIVVEGENPEPDPQPDPDPKPTPGPKRVIVFVESGSRTTNQAEMLMSLRNSSLQSMILDPDTTVPPELATLHTTIKGDLGFPAVAIVSEAGDVVSTSRLPDSWADLKVTLEKGGLKP